MTNETQIANLAGIPLDKVQEFVNQYISMELATNTMILSVVAIVGILSIIAFLNSCSSPRYRRMERVSSLYLWAIIVCVILLATGSWDRYKMTHYPIPYLLQDLRNSR